MKMAENSLFAILLRSPWWISFVVAAGVVALTRLFLPTAYAVFAALPFIVIGGYAGWQQLRAPSAAHIARSLERIRAMTAQEFSGVLEEAFRRDGYAVSRLDGKQADLELVKGGRTSLVAYKRWKATRTGIEPLRELQAVRDKSEAYECVYVAAGEVTDNAVKFAAQTNLRLLHGAELAQLLVLKRPAGRS
jgi:restriction system protein